MTEYAWLVPALPLLGAVIAAAGGKWLKGQSHLPVALGIALAFLVSLGLLFNSGTASKVVVYDWLTVADLSIPVVFRVDALTTMMLSMVTFVATLIAVFASGYMAGDPGYPRFFAFIGLFVFSMTGLVLSSNYVLTYAFWEGVGVCSYMLVGFWYRKPAAAAAAKKAMLVNRVGDFGFAVALFWMWSVMPGHSLDYDTVLNVENLRAIPHETLVGIALLLFWAATAKSAQVPLYVWLPDAMEGPTPVSALIHAATMVTAGVYLIARSSLLMAQVPGVLVVVATIGCVTSVLAAAIALTQTDLKRVMAYSTVSQLGYMFMALGAGIGHVAQLALVAAMFHLFTHAFFKALLFLASGSVMHSMGGVIDMRRFRGLRQRLPVTFWTFTMGALALAGIFPFAGFWSKDEILAALLMAGPEARSMGQPGWAALYTGIYWLAIITAGLTAFYTGRAYFLTFFGPEKLPSPDDPEAEAAPIDPHAETDEPVPAGHGHGQDDHGHGHDSHIGHESPPIMTVPLMVLAGCAALVGLGFGPTGLFAGHLEQMPGFHELGHAAHHFDLFTAIVGTVAAGLGLFIAWRMYAEPNDYPAWMARQAGTLYRWSYRKFGIDELYTWIVVLPTRGLATFLKYVDIYLVDNILVRGTSWIPRLLGREVLGPYQNGLIQYYAAATALGVALLLVVLLFI